MGPIKLAWLTIGTVALTVVSSVPAAAQIIVPGYPYPAYRYAFRDASVRLEVKPKEAAVYVDGYYAGIVDDFDGTFQRLHTTPGGHEITVYLEGHRTYTERVYLSPDKTLTIRHRMEPLAAGQVAERPPAPAPPQQFEGPEGGQPGAPPRGPFGRRGAPPNYPPPPQGDQQPPPGAPPSDTRRDGDRGTLSLSVTPGDAEVLVDGTRWNGQGQDQLLIELPEGRHNLQVRRTGYVGYLTDVQIRRGDTTTLDVRLKTQP